MRLSTVLWTTSFPVLKLETHTHPFLARHAEVSSPFHTSTMRVLCQVLRSTWFFLWHPTRSRSVIGLSMFSGEISKYISLNTRPLVNAYFLFSGPWFLFSDNICVRSCNLVLFSCWYQIYWIALSGIDGTSFPTCGLCPFWDRHCRTVIPLMPTLPTVTIPRLAQNHVVAPRFGCHNKPISAPTSRERPP